MCNSSFCCCQSSEERLKWASRSPARTCPLWSETVPQDARSRSPAPRPGSRLCWRCPPAASSRWRRSCWNTGCAPRTETEKTWAPWRPVSRAGWAGRSSGGWRCRRACACRLLTWRGELCCCQLRLCQLSFSSSAWSSHCRTSSHSWGPASSSCLYLDKKQNKTKIKYG